VTEISLEQKCRMDLSPRRPAKMSNERWFGEELDLRILKLEDEIARLKQDPVDWDFDEKKNSLFRILPKAEAQQLATGLTKFPVDISIEELSPLIPD
jgi:uncharacterized small protein (DUF1192 family)